MDAWVRWTYECNGWKWSVLDGAIVVAEGCEPSEGSARDVADQVIADLTR